MGVVPEDAATLPPRGGQSQPFPEAAPLLPEQAATLEFQAGPPGVPGYEILAELGRGGMGVVYKARQQGLKRLVALKMILTGGHASPAEQIRFRTEAEAVARLQHPNIVQIYEVGEHEGLPFFSLEYCAGGSLAARVNGRPLPASTAARLIEVLARAVHQAHRAGIIHRDLKPANILLAQSDRPEAIALGSGRGRAEHYEPKITDFGLAKQLDTSQGQTQTGAILGTPSYMAPEQAGGSAGSGDPCRAQQGRRTQIGPAADVYALGAILYELLTGRPPFKAATPLDTLLQVLSAEPVPPSRLQPQVPRDLETICLKCLHKDPQKRYRRALHLAEDLQRFLRGEPIRARATPAWQRLAKWVKRRPATAGVLGSILFLTLVGFGLVTWQWRRAERLRTEANEKRLEAEKMSARLALDRGVSLCEHGEVSRGMHWFAQSLRMAPQEADDFVGHIRLQLGAWSRHLHTLQAVLPHRGWVRTVAFSPDGKFLLTGAEDNAARLWDTATGKLACDLLPHGGWVYAVAFSPDGTKAVTGSFDKTARLWDVPTGKPAGPPWAHQGPVIAVSFSPDGKTVLTGGHDKTAKLWQTATGQLLRTFPNPDLAWVVAFSPNGRLLVTGCKDGSGQLWEADTGDRVGKRLAHQGAVWAVAFSPDSKVLVTASVDKTAKLWDTATAKPLGLPLRHSEPLARVAFSPDGKTLLTSSEHIAHLWETHTGQLLRLFEHQGTINALAFSPDGKLVLTGGDDHTARLWEAQTGHQVGPPLRHRFVVSAVAFSPRGTRVVTGSGDHTVRLWNVARGQPVHLSLPHPGPVNSVAFSPNGLLVLTGSDKARLWQTATGKAWGVPMSPPGRVWTAAFSPDGQTLVTATKGMARLWRTETGQPLGPPLQHQEWGLVGAAAFSPDGKLVLTGSDDQTVRLWDAATGQPHGPSRQLGGSVRAVAFHPDGKSYLTGSGGTMRFWGGEVGTAQLWQLDTHEALGPPMRHDHVLYCGALSPDGQWILTGSHDQTARLWQSKTGKLLGAVRHQGLVSGVAFSPDGKMLLTASYDHRAQLWDRTLLQAIGPPIRHPRPVSSVAFAPEGATLATGCHDGRVRLFSVPRPLAGKVERIQLWLQVVSGQEMDARGSTSVLDAATWKERRHALEQLGGPPKVTR
jgi:WD40 repeat protein/serine/threonine protein kinase